jgi:hypothetical protein
VRAALAAAGAVLGWDASPLRLTLLVETARVDDAVRALHAALIQ